MYMIKVSLIFSVMKYEITSTVEKKKNTFASEMVIKYIK